MPMGLSGGVPGEIDVEPAVLAGGGSDSRAAVLLPDHHHALRELSAAGSRCSWGTVGVAGIGTLLSTITINTRGKDVMLAVLFIPLIFPGCCTPACLRTTAAIVGAEDTRTSC